MPFANGRAKKNNKLGQSRIVVHRLKTEDMAS